MVMQVKPIRDCMSKIKQENPNTTVIYLSPQGEKLDNKLVVELSKLEALTLLCGRYEGVDERIIENDVDREISIGDYVISGGIISLIIQKISTIFLVNQGVFYGYFALLLLCAKHQSLPDVHSIEPWVHAVHQ
jgi:tRNA (guanine-N1)-methyltransferase